MPEKTIIDLSKLIKPDYQGSVQELYFPAEQPDSMVSKTMPGGSVFDVGTIFSIPQSDICRAALRHKIYSLLETPAEWEKVSQHIRQRFADQPEFLSFLCQGPLEEFCSKGANTHHLGMIDRDTGEVYRHAYPPNPSQYVLVRKFQIIKPKRVTCQEHHLWDYSHYYQADKYVIPLENIVRIGITSASSIYRNYLKLGPEGRRDYLKELGQQQELVPWTAFPRPIVDFTTKYEPEDRNLKLQDALLISGNNAETLINIIKMSLLGAILIAEFFNKIGLYLWDLKWEIAKDGDRLVFVDTIDTDSIRVTTKTAYNGKNYYVNFNKQSMRDYYQIMHDRWYEATKTAKEEAQKSGRSFLDHLRAGQESGIYPNTPQVDPDFINIQESKFSALSAYMYQQSGLEETFEQYREIGLREISYYDAKGALSAYDKINGL